LEEPPVACLSHILEEGQAALGGATQDQVCRSAGAQTEVVATAAGPTNCGLVSLVLDAAVGIGSLILGAFAGGYFGGKCSGE